MSSIKKLNTSLPYIILIILTVLLFLLPESLTNTLEYQRNAVSQLQLWRLFSAHLLHTNHWHLLMNCAGLALVMLLHGRYSRHFPLWIQFSIAALLISSGLYFFSPQMQHYVGLSGVLHALLIWGACMDIRCKARGGWLLLLLLCTKVIYEQWQGPDPQLAALINANVAIDAHLYGIIAGSLLWLVSSITLRSKNTR
ncbi:rhombosortase [Chromatiaceae bacterium AAb-1]|nr:rhombosortase [Chromatiaceae bacterium AAb-1]